MVEDSSTQRIARLTPVGAVLGLIASRVQAVTPQKCVLTAARGRTLAEDVAVSERPQCPIALRDGFAVEAAAIADAGTYMPVPLPIQSRRIDAGEPLPGGADAVVPLDAVTLRGKSAEAITAVAPGEGVLPAGGDAMAGSPLRRAGERLRAVDAAVMSACGIDTVSVRAPRIRIVGGGAAVAPPIGAALDLLACAVTSAGGRALDARQDGMPLDDALMEAACDAVIAVGGTGSGRRDGSVRALARAGRVAAHGIAVAPGETAAFGFAGERPVLLIPGRIDAALAVWLLIGRHLMARLAGGSVEETPAMLPLKRKVTSTIGITELIPVACAGGMAEPLASGYLSFAALARSDGWIVVPADSEGFQAGTIVAVRAWP